MLGDQPGLRAVVGWRTDPPGFGAVWAVGIADSDSNISHPHPDIDPEASDTDTDNLKPPTPI